jgi:hypothetical protein
MHNFRGSLHLKLFFGKFAFEAVFASCVEPLPLLEGLALVLTALSSFDFLVVFALML